MGISEVRQALLWCTLINYGILLLWFGMFMSAGGWMHRLHGRWFPMPRETFNALHYSMMGIYKLLVIVFNLTPLIALWIVG